MVLDRNSGECIDSSFTQIDDFLRSGDLLVLNQSKVIPARLLGKKPTGAAIELFLLKELGDDRWQCLLRPASRLKVGYTILFAQGLKAEVLSKEGQVNTVKFSAPYGSKVKSLIQSVGKMPLPPYIKREAEDGDKQRYQTVYAKEDGSVAAPTAGLHFTQEKLDALKQKGVRVAFLTLHVGLGTFLPVTTSNILEHQMHSELCKIDADTAELINATKSAGKRVIAVGSTSVRTLESFADSKGRVQHGIKQTDIFLYPGKNFAVIDGMLTNFHLPESTLIMMVAGFAGYQNTIRAYRKAVKDNYKFFSYGDAMLIL